jgi:hypothetical protein
MNDLSFCYTGSRCHDLRRRPRAGPDGLHGHRRGRELPYPAFLPQAPDPLPVIPPLAPFALAQFTIDLDSDDDELNDGLEVAVGTDPLDPDSDDDGIPDGEDVEWIQNVISGLSEDAFKSTGPGSRTASLSNLDVVGGLVAEGKIDQAIKKLQDLRARTDGCDSTADNDDWIVDCTAQTTVRDLIDLLIMNCRTERPGGAACRDGRRGAGRQCRSPVPTVPAADSPRHRLRHALLADALTRRGRRENGAQRRTRMRTLQRITCWFASPLRVRPCLDL